MFEVAREIGVEEGRGIGIREGRGIGILETAREMISDVLFEKFDFIPPRIPDRIRKTQLFTFSLNPVQH